MVLATSQSDFRAHMKDYMDTVVKEDTPVYVVRGKDTFVLQTQEKYNLMYDYINYDERKNGWLGKVDLEEKLIDAGLLPEPKSYTVDTLDDFFKDILENDYILPERPDAEKA